MTSPLQPLAERFRPRILSDLVGQRHLLQPEHPLYRALTAGELFSMILWGPPGTGKTTLARLFAHAADGEFVAISAVLSGVPELRKVVEQAEKHRAAGQRTLVFIDEVHRFNKAQQDALLPHVESGLFYLVGATTENPSFELRGALLSRVQVFQLAPLELDDLGLLLERALRDTERGLGQRQLTLEPEARRLLAEAADGDARRALNSLELCVQAASDGGLLGLSEVQQALGASYRRFDKGGDLFYDQISALHKAVRGSSPDAALYWLARMLDGGCDAEYVARRMVRMASEDIGNADPRALTLALEAWDSYTRLGSPEGDLALAQAAVYLACAPKSNAVYLAWKAVQSEIRRTGSLPVPLHLRNAPTRLMRELGHGREYRYAHDEPGAYAAGESYVPDALKGRRFYHPVERGLEIKIAEKLRQLATLDAAANAQRNPGKTS